MLRGWLTSSVLKTLSQNFGVLRSIHTTCVQCSVVCRPSTHIDGPCVCTVNIVCSLIFFVKFIMCQKSVVWTDYLWTQLTNIASVHGPCRKKHRRVIFLPTPLLLTLCPQYIQPVLWDGSWVRAVCTEPKNCWSLRCSETINNKTARSNLERGRIAVGGF